MAKMPKSDDGEAARQTAFNLLSRREHSTNELTLKLKQRGFEANTIATVIEKLSNEGYQSQTRYIESYIRSRTGKGFGPIRIRNELQQQGIDQTEITLGFEALELDWSERANQVYSKRFGDSEPNSLKEKMRRIQFLRYRGFDEQQIRAVEQLN